MRATGLWRTESVNVEGKLGEIWPSKVCTDSPSLQKKIYLALECRIGRMFLKKTHDSFAEFANPDEVIEQFRVEHEAVLDGKDPPSPSTKAGQSAGSAGQSADNEPRIRFDSAGRTMDESMLLRETGLEKGVYVVEKAPKQQRRPAMDVQPDEGHSLFPGPAPQLSYFVYCDTSILFL